MFCKILKQAIRVLKKIIFSIILHKLFEFRFQIFVNQLRFCVFVNKKLLTTSFFYIKLILVFF